MTTASLTERYLHAATREIPGPQRAEIRQELVERIGDDIDARVEAGVDPADAEQLALIALGDPDMLVAVYLDQPRYLIGPRLFPTWKRLLRVLALTVIPTVAVAFVFAQMLAHRSFGEIVGSTFVTLITLTIHLGFWTTLIFAVLDRALAGGPITEWAPESLPAVTEPPRHQMRTDVVANLSFIALFAFGILAHPLLLPFRGAAGETVPLFQPNTWDWLKWYLIGMLVLEVVFWISLFLRGRWNYRFAAVRTTLSLAFAIPAAWALMNDRILNHELLGRSGWDDGAELIAPGGVVAVVLTFTVVILAALWSVDGIIKAHRANRNHVDR